MDCERGGSQLDPVYLVTVVQFYCMPHSADGGWKSAESAELGSGGGVEAAASWGGGGKGRPGTLGTDDVATQTVADQMLPV